jgi:phenylpropionate dioxygenase-like ring-hydroxylating dioxygenase large terminal subunit
MKIEPIVSNKNTGLSHYWYPLSYSKTLKKTNKPLRFILLDVPIVLWRAHGTWRAHKDICPHRQAPLSSGQVINNTLVCPYHGWSFNSCGTLNQVPTLPLEKQLHSKPCLVPFPVYDDGFMVWICLQSQAQLLPPNMEHYRANKKKVLCIEKVFAHSIDDIIENFMDSPHTLFVHQGLIRDTQQLTPRIVEVTTNEHEVLVSHQPSREAISLFSRLINPNAKLVSHTDKFILPSHVQIDYYIGSEEPIFSAWVALRPMHAHETKLFITIALNFSWKNHLIAPITRLLAERILAQDRKILALQTANLAYEPIRNATSTYADCASNYIRKMRYYANEKYAFESMPKQMIQLNL